jgi:hypothetical protein
VSGRRVHWRRHRRRSGHHALPPHLLLRPPCLFTPYGLTWTFYATAETIGPIILGRAFDSSGSFASLLVILAGATSVSALLMLPLPRYSNASAVDLAS